jgi:archaellum biogenesis ATPase FlaH
MQLALEESADALAKGKVDDAYETIAQLNRNDLEPRVYTIVKWIEDFETRQAEREYKKLHPEKFKRIPTGFKRLDAITGGLEVGELGLILATTNQGKSIMLTNLAHHAIKLGYRVVYFTFEMSSVKIATRQDSRWLGLLYNKFKFYDFEKGELKIIDRRLRKMKKRWTGRLRIIGMPVRRCDANTVRTALDDLYQDEKFKPDMLLMDSGDHMISVDQFESFRLQQSAVYWDLKSLAGYDGYAIWTSTHAPRDFAHELATAEATGESYDKAKIADMVVSLNTPSKKSRRTTICLDMDDEAGDGGDQSDVSMMAKGKYLEMYLAKYRDGDSRISMPLDAQFARMLIKELEIEERTGDGKGV